MIDLPIYFLKYCKALVITSIIFTNVGCPVSIMVPSIYKYNMYYYIYLNNDKYIYISI